jgi:8-oxo-dGTP pyrophosphatase MutT (NUDIX family)
MYKRCEKPDGVAALTLVFDVSNLPDPRVLLVYRKAREGAKAPWLDGYLIAPGGGVERGEGPLDAARRETHEETGLLVPDFKLVGRLHMTTPTHKYLVSHFYKGHADLTKFCKRVCYTDIGDLLYAVAVSTVSNDAGPYPVYPNLKWIIPMALRIGDEVTRPTLFDIYEEYKPAHERFGGGY